MKVKVAQSSPTLRYTMDYRVHGILQARILEWVAVPVSRGSSQPRDRTQVFHIDFEEWLSWQKKKICLQCGRPGLIPWVGKIPWRRERLPTPVFWPGEFHGLCSPWVRKESDMTEGLSLICIKALCQLYVFKISSSTLWTFLSFLMVFFLICLLYLSLQSTWILLLLVYMV